MNYCLPIFSDNKFFQFFFTKLPKDLKANYFSLLTLPVPRAQARVRGRRRLQLGRRREDRGPQRPQHVVQRLRELPALVVVALGRRGRFRLGLILEATALALLAPAAELLAAALLLLLLLRVWGRPDEPDGRSRCGARVGDHVADGLLPLLPLLLLLVVVVVVVLLCGFEDLDLVSGLDAHGSLGIVAGVGLSDCEDASGAAAAAQFVHGNGAGFDLHLGHFKVSFLNDTIFLFTVSVQFIQPLPALISSGNE